MRKKKKKVKRKGKIVLRKKEAETNQLKGRGVQKTDCEGYLSLDLRTVGDPLQSLWAPNPPQPPLTFFFFSEEKEKPSPAPFTRLDLTPMRCTCSSPRSSYVSLFGLDQLSFPLFFFFLEFLFNTNNAFGRFYTSFYMLHSCYTNKKKAACITKFTLVKVVIVTLK